MRHLFFFFCFVIEFGCFIDKTSKYHFCMHFPIFSRCLCNSTSSLTIKFSRSKSLQTESMSAGMFSSNFQFFWIYILYIYLPENLSIALLIFFSFLPKKSNEIFFNYYINYIYCLISFQIFINPLTAGHLRRLRS